MLNSSYNSLPGVMKAHSAISLSPNFHSTLEEVGQILANNNLHDLIGISLIHRHNDLSDDEIMFQYSEQLNDETIALVTARTKVIDIDGPICPMNWRVNTKDSIEPLEYCLISDSKLDKNFFTKHQSVFSDVAMVLERNGLEKFLGLSLLRANELGETTPDYIAVEHTDSKRGANIVTLHQRDESINLITTLWRFDGAEQQRCIPFQQCVPRSPGHDITPGHEFIEGE
ncbi:hypothetical protein [Acinetobacter lactucae]|uniref:hypothetical protein n=1 Tax=Acinetobacter lactucae TaxID=1785128 RepID=UPI001580BA49|nr:hypothetical protein [Acinetobacter lactucae]NUF39309.1 hypothetical protein [Acinetobacter lactucae]